MPYIHHTARPQYKGAISEPFTGSISYIHIIMKSVICKVNIWESRKLSHNPNANLFLSLRDGGWGGVREDSLFPYFFFFIFCFLEKETL